MQIENYAAAEKKFLEICPKKKPYPNCWNNLSALYIKMGQAKKSLVYSNKAANSPSYSTPELAFANRARAQMLLKNYDAAQSSIAQALRYNPNSCICYLVHAQVHNSLKLYDQALKSSKKAENLCSSNYKTHIWTAYLYYKNNNDRLAQKKLRSILETFKDQEPKFIATEYLNNLEKRIPLKEPSL